jgi:hypothetical protein
MKKIDAYLAVPYTHPDPAVQEWRFERVTEMTAILIGEGRFKSIYSPITHSHPIDKHLARYADHEFWVEEFDMPFLLNSANLIILRLPGWDRSTGVRMEMDRAKQEGIPIWFLDPAYDAMSRIEGVAVLMRITK